MDKTSPVYVTEEGYKQYLLALEVAKKQYMEILKTRAEYGKNSVENHQTTVFDMEYELVVSNIKNLTETISNLVIIEDTNTAENTVNMGDIVTVQMLDDGEIRKVKIIGGTPQFGNDDGPVSITINSPMGKSIYKKNIGDIVSYTVGKNKISVMIISKEKTQEKTEKQPLSE